MIKYLIKRVLYGGLTLFIVAFLTFFLMNIIPGGPFLSEKSPSQDVIAVLNAKYGLDKPIPEQFVLYMSKAISGDFGPSIKQRGRTVAQIISRGFPVSAKIGGMAVLLALAIGIPLGSVAALKRGKSADNAIIVAATFGISVPSFVISTVLLITFGLVLGWLPTYGLSSAVSYIMPVVALAFYPTSYIIRLMRSSMLDVIEQDYIRFAKAKGVSERILLFKHALRNAILPIVTYLGPMIAYTMTGSFVIEKIFNIPGLGNAFISSITNRDYTMIMGTTLFLATLIIGLNILVDFAYTLIDRRIKLK